jgi:hypothetical protein
MKIETLPPHLKKFRLGVYTSDHAQPISLMRALGPLLQMTKEDPRLELVVPPLELPNAMNPNGGQQIGWNWLMGCDAVFYLHPETDTQTHSLALAWNLGIPIWAEYVDDIFHIDPTNPGWKARRNMDVQRGNVASVANMATLLTTVSQQNKDAIIEGLGIGSPEGKILVERKTLVLPEACLWDPYNTPRRKLISWRGLGSHGRDIDEAIPHVLDVAKRFLDWQWLFAGDPEICQEMRNQLQPVIGDENILMMPWMPTPFDMMVAWAGQSPYLHIVPLADTVFNRSKSHLAWLEASAVGAAVIAPDHLAEWQQPGVITYHNSPLAGANDDCLSEVMSREMIRYKDGAPHPNVAEARRAIYPHKTLKNMNRARWAILRKLAETRPTPAETCASAAELPKASELN